MRPEPQPHQTLPTDADCRSGQHEDALMTPCWICADPATHTADEAPLGDGAILCDDCFFWESMK